MLLAAGANVLATVHYVNLNSASPTPPYTNWATAAAVIQDAVDVAAAGDEVVVTNGVYATGGSAVQGNLISRVAVPQPLTVRSVNGPLVTVIRGYQVPGTTNGDGAIRCVYLTSGARLSGFTLTNGATGTNWDNYFDLDGGGAWCESFNAVVSNCVIGANSASSYGGGAFGGTLNNCTLIGNSAFYGGGAYEATLNNCTLTNNSAEYDGGGVFCESTNTVVSNCVIAGNTAGNLGGGALRATLNNCTLSGNSALSGGGAIDSTLSNCLLTGNSAIRSGGGAQYATLNNCTLIGNSAPFGGGASSLALDTPWIDRLTLSNCTLTGNSARWGGGVYGGRLNNCTLTGNWAHSDTSIYGEGGGAYWSWLNNCTLTGNSATNSGGGARGCTLTNCTLSGNSAVYGGGASGVLTDLGGLSCALNNCTLTGNSAFLQGGGAYRAAFYNCTLTNNSALYGGGASGSRLTNCTLTGNSAQSDGGGAYEATLNNCTLTNNSAEYNGGGAWGGGLNNCTLTGNSAFYGGGAGGCTLNNCIVYFNTASDGPDGANYDPSDCSLNSCCTEPDPGGVGNITLAPRFMNYADGNLRLQSNSPCINAGTNLYAAGSTDLDGRPRIVGGAVDMGAYEYQGPGMSEFIGWLQRYRLPADGSADYTDADGDGMNNWQEWRCLTDPTNSLSALKMLTPSNAVSGVTLCWQSVAGVRYSLERSMNLTPPMFFAPLATAIPGQPGTTVFTDTTAIGPGPFFYRVCVQ